MKAKTKTTATKEEATPALVPKLRFPEFRGTEAWHFNSLDSVCEVLNNRRRPITGNERTPGPYPYYGASGIVDYVGDFIFDERLLLVGEDGAKWGAFEKTAFIADGKYWVNNHAHVLKPTAANDTLLENYLTMLDLSPFVTGAAPPKLTLGKLKGIPIPLPPKPAEQQKIAECLSSVDELMAAQARKVDALKTHKKGLMQQLFPREGETQPRLRFPEFQNAGEWEDDTLGAVCELYQPVTLSSSQLSMTGEHLVYGANGVIGTHNAYNHEESEIAVTCRGATCGEMTTTQPKSWITGNAMVVKPRTTKLRKDFIFQYFKNHGLKSVISGSAQPQITRTGFAPLVIFFPKPEEQQRIATCLSSLDALITAETQKHEALKTHKKGLMQQLFPSPEEVAA